MLQYNAQPRHGTGVGGRAGCVRHASARRERGAGRAGGVRRWGGIAAGTRAGVRLSTARPAARALRHGSWGCDTVGGPDHDTAARAPPCATWARPVRTWGCCWAVGCALGALSLFLTRFDSVLFLSQFLDTFMNPVHEHCSSQIFFEICFN